MPRHDQDEKKVSKTAFSVSSRRLQAQTAECFSFLGQQTGSPAAFLK